MPAPLGSCGQCSCQSWGPVYATQMEQLAKWGGGTASAHLDLGCSCKEGKTDWDKPDPVDVESCAQPCPTAVPRDPTVLLRLPCLPSAPWWEYYGGTTHTFSVIRRDQTSMYVYQVSNTERRDHQLGDNPESLVKTQKTSGSS